MRSNRIRIYSEFSWHDTFINTAVVVVAARRWCSFWVWFIFSNRFELKTICIAFSSLLHSSNAVIKSFVVPFIFFFIDWFCGVGCGKPSHELNRTKKWVSNWNLRVNVKKYTFFSILCEAEKCWFYIYQTISSFLVRCDSICETGKKQ